MSLSESFTGLVGTVNKPKSGLIVSVTHEKGNSRLGPSLFVHHLCLSVYAWVFDYRFLSVLTCRYVILFSCLSEHYYTTKSRNTRHQWAYTLLHFSLFHLLVSIYLTFIVCLSVYIYVRMSQFLFVCLSHTCFSGRGDGK